MAQTISNQMGNRGFQDIVNDHYLLIYASYAASYVSFCQQILLDMTSPLTVSSDVLTSTTMGSTDSASDLLSAKPDPSFVGALNNSLESPTVVVSTGVSTGVSCLTELQSCLKHAASRTAILTTATLQAKSCVIIQRLLEQLHEVRI